ncbi:MAG: hypothetical protein JNM17_23625 [Archangium sp.]|nr:hypothetical protein [Archangium sp.]
MLILLRGWLVAFALTQALEMPIYWRISRSWRVAFFASAITHPIVWFVFPSLAAWIPWSAVVLLAEGFAVVVEAWWLKSNGVERALFWSLVTNAFSATCGLLLRELTGLV